MTRRPAEIAATRSPRSSQLASCASTHDRVRSRRHTRVIEGARGQGPRPPLLARERSVCCACSHIAAIDGTSPVEQERLWSRARRLPAACSIGRVSRCDEADITRRRRIKRARVSCRRRNTVRVSAARATASARFVGAMPAVHEAATRPVGGVVLLRPDPTGAGRERGEASQRERARRRARRRPQRAVGGCGGVHRPPRTARRQQDARPDAWRRRRRWIGEFRFETGTPES